MKRKSKILKSARQLSLSPYSSHCSSQENSLSVVGRQLHRRRLPCGNRWWYQDSRLEREESMLLKRGRA